MKILILPLFIVISFSIPFVHGQSVETILEKYEEQLNKTQDFHTDVTYTLYEGFSGNKILESLKGISAIKNKASYTKIGPTEFVFNSDYTLKISHSEKVMLITNSTFKNDIWRPNFASVLLENFDSKGIADKNSFWECEFIPKKHTNMPYSKYVIHISKEDYKTIKQILFFSTPLKHNNKEKEQYAKNQRLEIEFVNKLKKEEFPKEKFLLETYTTLINLEYSPKPIIKGYKIINTLNNTLEIH